jgi:hypothetical protein
LNITDLLEVMVSESKDLATKLHNNEHIGRRATEKLRSACDLLKVVCINSKDILDQLFKNSGLLTQVVGLLLQFLKEREHFVRKEIQFFFDSLLPVLNLYNETFVLEGNQAIMLSS